MHPSAQTFQPRIDKLSFDELGIRARQARDLVESPAWEFLCSLLAGHADDLHAQLRLTGEPPSQAMYAAKHGELLGIERVLCLPEAVIELAERASERESRRLAAVGGELH